MRRHMPDRHEISSLRDPHRYAIPKFNQALRSGARALRSTQAIR